MSLIWLGRNSWVFYSKFGHPKSLISHAKQSMVEFTVAQHSRTQALGVRNTIVRVDAIWSELEGEVVKVNQDVFIDIKTNRVGIGVIIRNSTCDIMAYLFFFLVSLFLLFRCLGKIEYSVWIKSKLFMLKISGRSNLYCGKEQKFFEASICWQRGVALVCQSHGGMLKFQGKQGSLPNKKGRK